ncbi:hypothetical protein NL64_26990 [Pseudomonas fluorescens]|nr:hypothetical protein NL64_26990 [Pseudomonas fluorescens]
MGAINDGGLNVPLVGAFARYQVAAGQRWCLEHDLENFFDRVKYDVLLAYIERQIEDMRVLMLISRYLEAGTMSGGLVCRQQKGKPHFAAAVEHRWQT